MKSLTHSCLCTAAWVAGAALGTAPVHSFAQQSQPAGATTTLHVNSQLVSLDVVVTDDKGVPVPGLTKDDFTVYQDQKVQIIHTFDSWEKRPEIPAKPTVDAYGRQDWGDSPLAIFVLDDASTDFSDASYAAQMMERYLKAQPQLLAVPSMLLIVTDQGYKTLVGFTRDRDALLKGVQKRPPVLPSRLMRDDATPILVQSFVMLQQIALAYAGLRQHKSIIWVGPGFASIDMTEIDATSAASLKKEIRETVDLLLDTKTTVYKIDPVATNTSTAPEVDPDSIDLTGADTGSAFTAGEDPLEDNFNFNEFAVETGGTYFYGQNDLDRYFHRAVEQTDDFYTMTYRPPDEDSAGPLTYRNIRVVCNRPGLHVATRTGFYANEPPEPPPTPKVLGMSLSSVAAGDMDFSGVGVRVTNVTAGKQPGTISVTYEIEDKSLDWTEKPSGIVTMSATAVITGLDKDKNVLSFDARKLGVYLPAAQANKRFTAFLTVQDDVSVTPKVTDVRLIVRDSSGRIGTADISPDAYKDVVMLPAKSGKHK